MGITQQIFNILLSVQLFFDVFLLLMDIMMLEFLQLLRNTKILHSYHCFELYLSLPISANQDLALYNCINVLISGGIIWVINNINSFSFTFPFKSAYQSG